MEEARYYTAGSEPGSVRCELCPRGCVIPPGGRGFCLVRKAGEAGKLYTVNYGKVPALSFDPIEKKPFARFYPGTRILSAGTAGCNLDCMFCQNHTLSRSDKGVSVEYLGPDELCGIIAGDSENLGIAFTYNEPSVWYEYVYDTAALLKKRSPEKKAVLVSNGYISAEPLEMLLPFVDAVNFDLKGPEKFYRTLCGASPGAFEAVTRSISMAVTAGRHVEISFLAIDGKNTDDESVSAVIDFIASLSPEIPFHISRCFPNYRMRDIAPTRMETLRYIRDRALEKLEFVYLGNVG
ncbi:MAG: AmmeMemoRadiSam system radical SAM enzyme [Spirochaetaceae bacterium]|jgi:pyruvate formate lyase activating enzyme|nr:AmmeMemoRadiSam system radical SAM enzyme [Spirochaetaceae bacterium]